MSLLGTSAGTKPGGVGVKEEASGQCWAPLACRPPTGVESRRCLRPNPTLTPTPPHPTP